MRWAIVSDKIETFYESDVKVQYGGEWGTMNHVAVPETLDWTTVSWNGSEIVEDPLKVQAKTAQAWTALRTERNARLAASDYTQLQDAHLSVDKKAAWADYRQALRDLPDGITSPVDAVPWPLKPGELPPVVPVASSRFGALLEQAGVEASQEVVEVTEPVVEVPEVPVAEEVPAVPVVEEVPAVQEVVEAPVVVEVEEVVEVPEPVVEVPEVPAVPVAEEVPAVQGAEPVQEVVEVPEPAPEPVPEPAPVELAASEPVV